MLALQTELAKIGVKFTEENLFYKLDCSTLRFGDKIRIATYEDHRMAMAFAPLALKVKEIEIEKAKVVDKSYPDYWLDLKKAGFNINGNFFINSNCLFSLIKSEIIWLEILWRFV